MGGGGGAGGGGGKADASRGMDTTRSWRLAYQAYEYRY
jgi:hypothetical protein